MKELSSFDKIVWQRLKYLPFAPFKNLAQDQWTPRNFTEGQVIVFLWYLFPTFWGECVLLIL